MPRVQAKRKATADISDSPPKRITRARGKATDEEGPEPNSTKIVTASVKVMAAKKKPAIPARGATRKTKTIGMEEEPVGISATKESKEEPLKASARIKKAAIPVRPSKRKARADEEANFIQQTVADKQPSLEEQAPREPPKAKARQRKVMTSEKDGSKEGDAPRVRGRQPRITIPEEVPKTRGRPKRTANPIPAESEGENPIEEQLPVKKSTRGRTATVVVRPRGSNVPKPAIDTTKKRVKFQDEPDKENIPIDAAGPKKSAMKPTGIKARPMRKAVATRGSTRGKKVLEEDAQNTREKKSQATMPLSPKKDKQIAKSDPASSDDELCGAKTPVRALSASPAKRPMSPIKDFGSVSKLNFNQSTPPLSPVKKMSASVLASPARRPPASPFRDALKNSPKKLDLGTAISQPVLLSSRTPIRASLLQESPKRSNFNGSAIKLMMPAPNSSCKASLLQSPARRPMGSPHKIGSHRSPARSVRKDLEITVSNKQSSPTQFDPSPAGQIMDADMLAQRNDNNDTPMDDETTMMRSKTPESTQNVASEPAEHDDSLPQEPAVLNDIIEVDHVKDSGEAPADVPEDAVVGSVSPTMPTAPLFKFASPAFRRVSIESELSEDELASPQKGYGVTPLRQLGVSTRDFGTPAIIDGRGQICLNPDIAFTPLVDQLNSWTASSPDKNNAMEHSRQARGVFSVGGVPTPTNPTLIDPGLVNESPVKSSFFDDEMAVHSESEDTVPVDFTIQPPIEKEPSISGFQVSQDSLTSEDYGDENMMPNDLDFSRTEQDPQDHTLTCTPAKVFTPARPLHQQHREIHTVSKVPLRASAEDLPLKVSRQRSRSLGGALAAIHSSGVSNDIENTNVAAGQPATPLLLATTIPLSPTSAVALDFETPTRTIRKGIIPDVLKGAVVHVDVHTTEGADASGIFVDLLTQMGARCVKQWNWNPHTSLDSSLAENDSTQGMSPNTSKIGITHVVYKDGGVRTLEKVRSSNGVVLCVGVGWVLE